MSTTPRYEPAADVRFDAKMRVDEPHGPVAASESPVFTPPLDLLHAIAGRDAQSAPQQLRGQALELAVILRDKQRLLEQRESELNARTALLESDLRAARLSSYREVPPRVSTADGHEPLATAATDTVPTPTPTPTRAEMPIRAEAAIQPPAATKEDTSAPALDIRAAACEPTETPSPPTQVPLTDEAVDASPRVNEELRTEFEHLEQQRQQLRQREEKLNRRERHVEEMHDEITQLHREALELRLASEQVWADLTEEFPSEQLAESMAQIRAKLADHYRLANDTLSRRKDDLHEMRNELNLQEQRLRHQRRDIQMWADRRYDEIESRMARIALRERELDQLEADFHRQSLQWQQQREAYRQEIEQLSWQIHEHAAR